MGQVVQLDATTVLIKSDSTNDMAEIIDFISKKNDGKPAKQGRADAFFPGICLSEWDFERKLPIQQRRML